MRPSVFFFFLQSCTNLNRPRFFIVIGTVMLFNAVVYAAEVSRMHEFTSGRSTSFACRGACEIQKVGTNFLSVVAGKTALSDPLRHASAPQWSQPVVAKTISPLRFRSPRSTTCCCCCVLANRSFYHYPLYNICAGVRRTSAYIRVHVTQKFARTSRGSVDNIAGEWPALPTQQTVPHCSYYVHRVRVPARIRFLPRRCCSLLASIFDRKFRHEKVTQI